MKQKERALNNAMQNKTNESHTSTTPHLFEEQYMLSVTNYNLDFKARTSQQLDQSIKIKTWTTFDPSVHEMSQEPK